MKKSIPDFYRETRFRTEEAVPDWPGEFAIITAYATTGEHWPQHKNEEADQELHHHLSQCNPWLKRITGFSPSSGHCEPGWAVDMPFHEACDVGLRFKQDAIYVVRQGDLYVTYCDARRELIPIAPFKDRIDPTGSGQNVT